MVKRIGFVVLCVMMFFPFILLAYLLDIWVLKGDSNTITGIAIVVYPTSIILLGILRMIRRRQRGEKVIRNYLAFYLAAFFLHIVITYSFVKILFGDRQAAAFIGIIVLSFPALLLLIKTIRQFRQYQRGEEVKISFVYTIILNIILGVDAQNSDMSFDSFFHIVNAVGSELDQEMSARKDKSIVSRRVSYVFNNLLNAVTILSLLTLGLYQNLPGSPGLYFSGIVLAYGALLLLYSVIVRLSPQVKDAVVSLKGIKEEILNNMDTKQRKASLIGYNIGIGISLTLVALLVLIIVFLVFAR